MNTCVTGYWNVTNKHGDAFYEWFEKTLKVRCPYVIFSDAATMPILKKYRGDLPTVYIERELSDFETQKYASRMKTDPLHCPSVHLNMIWNEKVYLVQEAARLNPFQTEFFTWIDAGLSVLRDSDDDLSTSWPNVRFETLPKNKFVYCSSDTLDINKVNTREYYHHVSGGIWTLHKDMIDHFTNIYTRYLNRLISDKNIWTEQVILTHMLKDTPELFHKLCDGYGMSFHYFQTHFYDFIEIGTSDFDTEIQKRDGRVGISVEPVKYYLNNLPNITGCKKLHLAISDYNGTTDVYSLPEQEIRNHRLPHYLKGCNSIGKHHPTVLKVLNERNIDTTIIRKETISCKTLGTFLETENIGVFFLKIDTEGHDVAILRVFLAEEPENERLPYTILFETNTLSQQSSVDDIVARFETLGYDVKYRSHDTFLKRNLRKISRKGHFTSALPNYYIEDYPKGYNPKRLPHKNNLEDAKAYCVKHNCSGVTYQNGKYEVRSGKYLEYYGKQSVFSWVYI